jgi:FkbM family methyltransferase
VLRDEFSIAIRQWFRDRGDETLRLQYALNPACVVFDLGGYRGDFAAEIVGRFGSRVYVFEPVRAYYLACVQRFAGSPQVQCFNYGLMATAGSFGISLEENSSSIVKDAGAAPTEIVRVESFQAVVDELGVGEIDLLKINIEGGEYEVVRHLISTGLIARVRHLQVQFHDFIPDARVLRDALRHDLRSTHRESWNYPFVWESWERV